MATCSICERAEAAAIINELLEKKTGLDVIAEQTGFHRSSVHRHSKKCFPAWRAARLKARRGKNDDTPGGRMIISWPERDDQPAHFSYFDRILHEQDLLPSDDLFVVQYAKPLELDKERQPSPSVSDKLIEEASAENKQRG